MSSTIPTLEPTQSTPATALPGASKEEKFQELIQEALAPVLPELLRPQPTDLEIHANERVIKDLTKDPTIKNMEIGATVPATEEMTPEARKALAKTLTRELDNFLETQVLYEPDDITCVPPKKDAGSQNEDSGAVGCRKVFATKQRNLADQHLTVGEACRRLGIKRHPISWLPIVDPGSASGIRPFALRPWQATGIQWMFSQESEPIRGGIVADACGTGKTLMALTLIFLDAKRRSEDPNAVFRPNLIVVPSMIFHVWFKEIESRFGDAIELHLFYGWKEILPNFKSQPNFLLNYEEIWLDKLAKAVEALDPKNPHTAFTVFLTTYNTWRKCQCQTDRELLLSSRERGVIWQTTSQLRKRNPDPSISYDELFGHCDEPRNDGSVPPLPDLPEETTRGSTLPEKANKSKVVKTKKELNKEKEARAKERWMKIFQAICDIHWGRIICDVGSYMKSPTAQRHQAIAGLAREATWLLEAAPIRNHISDISGYFNILSKFIPGCKKDEHGRFILPLPPGYEEGEGFESDIDCYQQWSEVCQMPPQGRPWGLLSRRVIESIICKGPIPADVGYDTLPIINRLSELRRSMGDVIYDDDGQIYRVGEKTPPLRVMTIELRYSNEAQTYHNKVYKCMIEGPNMPETDDAILDAEEVGLQDIKRHRSRRRLSILGFSPLLDKFIRKLAGQEELGHYIKGLLSGADKGFSVFWAATSGEKSTKTIPSTRAAQATYLAKGCPRLRYLVRILDSMGVFDKPAPGSDPKSLPRFLVLCQWPLSVWLVEMFLVAMGIKYRRIHPGLLPQNRVDIVASFKSAESEARVLLTTYRCGSLGLNDHRAFSNLVLMEPDQHINGQFQAIDRIHRIGQQQPQRVWILFMEHTINRYIDYKNIEKILPQIAGEQHHNFAPKIEELRQSRPSDLGLRDAATGTELTEALKAQRLEDIKALAYDYLCRPDKLGLEPGCAARDSRFGNMHDLDTEDVDDPHHSTYARSRRTPVNEVTRARKSEEERLNNQKRRFEEAFGDFEPAMKHMKLKRSLEE
ncbi:hypothetical protein PoHVEF18_005814 [Penicillium ochrochloron]